MVEDRKKGLHSLILTVQALSSGAMKTYCKGYSESSNFVSLRITFY